MKNMKGLTNLNVTTLLVSYDNYRDYLIQKFDREELLPLTTRLSSFPLLFDFL